MSISRSMELISAHFLTHFRVFSTLVRTLALPVPGHCRRIIYVTLWVRWVNMKKSSFPAKGQYFRSGSIRDPVSGSRRPFSSGKFPRAAIDWARTLACERAGAVAFSRTADPELGEFDPAEVPAKFGDVPDDLSELRLEEAAFLGAPQLTYLRSQCSRRFPHSDRRLPQRRKDARWRFGTLGYAKGKR